MIVAAQACIVTGAFKYSVWSLEKQNALGIVHAVVFGLAMILFEILHQKYKRGEQPYTEPYAIITTEEFEKRVAAGEELMILDDLVLDVSKYLTEHPGGKFVVHHNIGRDISKFFYGGYVLENGTGQKPYTHSNVARNIVNSLAIGRLEQKAKTFTAKIKQSKEVGVKTNVFVMDVSGPGQQFRMPASTDLSSIGRHFLIRSFSMPKVKRHYTISTCLKPQIYQEYIKAIRAFKEGRQVEFND